ncbi:MAG: hypothetical protein AAF564_00030 [Bacteroidota bacterium]
MKTPLLVVLLFLFAGITVANAQTRVHYKDLSGTWKLEITLDEKDLEENSAWDRIVSKTVDGVLDEINIYFEFKRENELRVVVDAFGEKEVEYSEWHIDDGALYFGDGENFDMDDNIWMFDGRNLAAYTEDRRGKLVKDNQNVYLHRVN